MEVRGCPIWLKNEISVHILLWMWHEIVLKHVQITNASYGWYSYFPPTWPDLDRYYDLYRRLRLQFLVLLMMGAVTPETCRVILQWNKSGYILLRLVGLLFNMNYDARNHELKIHRKYRVCCVDMITLVTCKVKWRVDRISEKSEVKWNGERFFKTVKGFIIWELYCV